MEGDKTKTKPESVMDLMEKLHNDIQSSDWLTKNTAEKWQADNPELAAEYIKAINKESSTTSSSSSDSSTDKNKTADT
ncbi:hypothetical protein SNE40_013402 [Patella caerulea]|uniref:Uncharacterized protein n=1 Tax=Patella caerulea TaxID=87958 RepID=A0AAN8JC85_PATCE